MLQFQRQRQRISQSEKTKQWKLDNMKYFLGQSQNYWRLENQRMYTNYQFYHNILDQEEMNKYCDPLIKAGLDENMTKNYIQAFNKAPTKIDVLMGEEKDRPWKYYVVSPSPTVTNEIIREKTRATREYVEMKMMQEVERLRAQAIAESGIESGELSEEEAQQMMQQVEAELQELETTIMDPDTLKLKYKNHKTLKEQLMHKLLKIAEREQRLRAKKTGSFFHGNISGLEAVLVNVVNNQLNVEVRNPLGIAFHKSPDVEWIEDGDWVVLRSELSMGAILDFYGRYLSNKDIKELETALSSIYGMDTPYGSPTGKSVDSFGSPNNPLYRGTGTWWEGLFGSSLSDEETYTVDTVYWRSQQETGYLQITDAEGNTRTEYVSENFPVPDDAEKVSFKDEEDVQVTQYMWFDEESQSQFTLEWIWTDQIYEGTCINDHIFLNIRPYKYALVSPENPMNVKLPVFGSVYGAANAPIVATMDRLMPWAKLYILTFNKFVELIMKDYGKVFSLNNLMIDGDIGVTKTVRYMVNVGILPHNPLANQEVAGSAIHNMKLGESVDLGNTDKIVNYINILSFIEAQIGDAIGVQKPREGVTMGGNVTDNQQDLVQQSKVTRMLFAKHDAIWENVLNGAVRTLQLLYNDGKVHYIRNILSDEEIAILEIEANAFDKVDYMAQIEDSAKTQQILDTVKQNIQALIQNDRIQLSTLMDMLQREDLAEIRSEVEKMEDKFAQMQQQQAQAQGENAAKMQQEMQREMLQAEMTKMAYDRETQLLVKDKERENAQAQGTQQQATQITVTDKNNETKVETTKLTTETQKQIADKKASTDIKKTEMTTETSVKVAAMKPKPKPAKKK